MTKTEKKINIKERIDDVTIDLSLSDIAEIPVKDIVSILFLFFISILRQLLFFYSRPFTSVVLYSIYQATE